MTTKCQQELNVDFLAMKQTAGHFKRGVHRNIVQLLLIIFICNRHNVEHTHCCISATSQPLQGSPPHFSSQLNSTHNSHCHYKALDTPPAANKSASSLSSQHDTFATEHQCRKHGTHSHRLISAVDAGTQQQPYGCYCCCRSIGQTDGRC